MLYLYNGKIYIKPFENKIVEVEIKKELRGGFNVIPTKNIIVDSNIKSQITPVSIEEAYKLIHKRNKDN